MKRLSLFLTITIAATAAMVLTSCSTAGYYGQAMSGQLKIINKRRPIAEVITDPATPAALKARLKTVSAIRQFASRALGLPDNKSYKSYADTGRRYVVWNVFATPALSMRPKTWCFPVAGCVAYRGYFKKKRAAAYARRLENAGLDVNVAGISAYSTLGWFADPVLNTMLFRNDIDLAEVIFHELVHQMLYVKNDTTFNESFATFVASEGVRRWLAARNKTGRYTAYLRQKAREQQFIALLLDARTRLQQIYKQEIPDAEKRRLKQAAFAQLRQDYATLRASWSSGPYYDHWFRRPLNNAHLAPIGSYYDYVPGFATLLRLHGGDLDAFYKAAREIAALAPAARRARMAMLINKEAAFQRLRAR